MCRKNGEQTGRRRIGGQEGVKDMQEEILWCHQENGQGMVRVKG